MKRGGEKGVEDLVLWAELSKVERPGGEGQRAYLASVTVELVLVTPVLCGSSRDDNHW